MLLLLSLQSLVCVVVAVVVVLVVAAVFLSGVVCSTFCRVEWGKMGQRGKMGHLTFFLILK